MAEPLTPIERRALGVLVEKALTASSPEPLSLNAVVVGCNQKSNRDPVTNLEEPELDACLTGLQKRLLVFHVLGGRVERWRHNLYEAWDLTRPQAAIMAELFLRGPQTAAELRTRASRMVPIEAAQLNDLIHALIQKGLLVWLTPEARRGAIISHQCYPEVEFNAVKAKFSTGYTSEEFTAAPAVEAAPPAPGLVEKVDALGAQVQELQAEVASLKAQLSALQQSLGVSPQG